MGTHPIFESDFDCLTALQMSSKGGWESGSPTVPSMSGESEWVEHSAPTTGRTYYYNKRTKQSLWEKPAELMTPGEKHLAKCPWKSHKNADGKIYYYNNVTKSSSWSEPDDLKRARKESENIDSQNGGGASGMPGAGGGAAPGAIGGGQGALNPMMTMMMMNMMMQNNTNK